MEEERIITIVGSVLAKEGAEFTYAGPDAACEGCKVARVCHNTKLRVGRRYRVAATRKTHHECPLHEGGAEAVEVVDSEMTVVIPTSQATRRTRIIYTPVCDERFCKGYAFCHPDGMMEKEKYVVMEVLGSYSETCPKGIKNLKLAKLRHVP